jgi:hypothetical protein
MITFQFRVFVQIEQLHLFVPRLRSMSASNRTAPQWQLPLKVLIIMISQKGRGPESVQALTATLCHTPELKPPGAASRQGPLLAGEPLAAVTAVLLAID